MKTDQDLALLKTLQASVATLQRCGEVKISATSTGLLLQVEGGHDNPGLSNHDLDVLDLCSLGWSKSLQGWHFKV